MVTWQQWEGRVINGRFPLRLYLGGSEHSAVYLTEINGSKAVIKLIPSDAAQASAVTVGAGEQTVPSSPGPNSRHGSLAS